MLKKPETCKEAVSIIQVCNSDKEYKKPFFRSLLIKAGCITLALFVIAFIIGAVSRDYTNTLLILPMVCVIGLISLFPYWGLKRTTAQIRNGRFFAGKTESEIMALAERYVDSYNRYLEKKG